jgi:hypothetical protein
MRTNPPTPTATDGRDRITMAQGMRATVSSEKEPIQDIVLSPMPDGSMRCYVLVESADTIFWQEVLGALWEPAAACLCVS